MKCKKRKYLWYLYQGVPEDAPEISQRYVAPVRFEQILPRSDGNDTRGVNRFMAAGNSGDEYRSRLTVSAMPGIDRYRAVKPHW